MGLELATGKQLSISDPFGLDSLNQITMCGWFKVTTTVSNTILVGTGMVSDSFTSGFWLQTYNNDLYYSVNYTNPETINGIIHSFTDTDSYHFVCMTSDGTDFKVYLDGIKRIDIGFAYSVDNTQRQMLFNPHSGFQQSWNAFDWRLYNRAITQEEANTIFFSKGSDKIVNGLIGRWLMMEKPEDETADYLVLDRSGNENNGIPYNSPVYKASPLKLKSPRITR